MSLEENITRYSITLTALEQAMPDPTLEQVLDVLIARDAVQRGLNEIEEQDFPNVIRIVERDKRLSKYAPVISINDELDQWKRSLQPPQDYWWWYMDTPRGWGWSIFVIIIFTHNSKFSDEYIGSILKWWTRHNISVYFCRSNCAHHHSRRGIINQIRAKYF